MKNLIKIGLFILVILFFGSVILNFLNNSVEHMFLDDEDEFGCNIELPKGTEYSLPEYKYPWNDSLLKFNKFGNLQSKSRGLRLSFLLSI